jgi:outer membrane protein assembly factor BamB
MADQEQREPQELLEQLDVLRHLDAHDVISEAIHAGDEAQAAADGSSRQARRRLWLGLRLALIITLGVVLIVAAIFRYKIPAAPEALPDTTPETIPVALPETPTTPTPAPVVVLPPVPQVEGQPTASEIQQQIDRILKWQLQLEDDEVSGATFGPDGEIYLTGYNSEERALSLYRVSPRGQVQWRHRFAELVNRELLVGPDGSCYMYDYHGRQYAFSSRGQLRWQLEPGGKGAAMAVSADGNTFYMVRHGGSLLTQPDERRRKAYDSVLYAVDRSGRVRWEQQLPGEIAAINAPAAQAPYSRGLVVAADGTLYLSTPRHPQTPATLWAYNPDGSLRWQYDLVEDDYQTFARLAVGPHGEVYAATRGSYTDRGLLYALDAGGRLKWLARIDVRDYSCPQLGADGTIYITCAPYEVGRDTDQLRALDPRDGSELWHVSGRGSDPLLGPDGMLYFTTHDGLQAITPEGMVRWQVPSSGGPPVLAPDGRLYVGNRAISPEGRTLYKLPLAGELMIDRAGNFYTVSRQGEIKALAE